MPEFVIPKTLDDLEESCGADTYSVASTIPADDGDTETLTSAVNESVDALCDDPLAILSSDIFDVLYSVVKYFSHVPAATRGKAVDILCTGVQMLCTQVDSHKSGAQDSLDDDEEGRDSSKATPLRNAIKMHAFLLCSLVERAERVKEEAPQAPQRGRKRSTKAKSAVASETAWSWDSVRDRAVHALWSISSLELEILWLGAPEETFWNLLTHTATLLLENPACTKSTDCRADTLAVLANAARASNESAQSVAGAIVHAVHMHEHVSSAVATLPLSEEQPWPLTREVLRECVDFEYGGQGDSQAARAAGQLIADTATAEPRAVLAALPMLLPALSGEAYALRNGVVSAIGRLLSTILRGDTASAASADASPEAITAARTRESLWEILEERAQDVHAFARTRAVQVWAQLVAAQCVPLAVLPTAVAIASRRVRDRSSFVRRAGMQLLCTLLEFNPFRGNLDPEQLRAQLAETEARIAEREPSSATSNAETDDVNAAAASSADSVHNGKNDGEGEGAGEGEGEGEGEGDGEGEGEGDGEGEGEDCAAQRPRSLEKLHRLRAYFRDALQFAEAMGAALSGCAELLGSRTVSDVTEAVRFIVAARAFGVPGSDAPVRRMLLLVWSREPAVCAAVRTAFVHVFLDGKEPREAAALLSGAAAVASVGEGASMEEALRLAAQGGAVRPAVVQALWDAALAPARGAVQHARAAIDVLRMLAAADPRVLGCRAAELYGRAAEVAPRECCAALAALGAHLPRARRDHPALARCAAVCRTGALASMEQAVAAAYALAEHPERWAADALRAALAAAPQGAEPLARAMFLAGHIAVKELVRIEDCAKAVRAAKPKGGKGEKGEENGENGEDDAIAQELGFTDFVERENEADDLLALARRSLLSADGLLGAAANVVVRAARSTHAPPLVREAAVVALCRLMAVSEAFCERNLQLLFTHLERASSPITRSNIVIALGDFSFRFPNLIEPWTGHIYARLRDNDAGVRKNTLMVLTHLILNDMVKVKGQISEMALCMLDADLRIRDLAKLFFTELSHKSANTIYNILPDMLSHLSVHPAVSQSAFRTIVRFLMTFIERDRQAESLVEKIAQRFRACESTAQMRDLSYCLTLINYTDRPTKKLIECFSAFSIALGDEECFEHFTGIVTKAKKGVRADTRDAVDEFENRVRSAHERGADDAAAEERASRRRGAAPSADGAEPLADTDEGADDGAESSDGGESDTNAVKEEEKPTRQRRSQAPAGRKGRRTRDENTDPQPRANASGNRANRRPLRRVVDTDSEEEVEDVASDSDVASIASEVSEIEA